MNTKDRKLKVALTGLYMGFAGLFGGFVLGTLAKLDANYTTLFSAFCGLVGVAVGSFMVGNSVEHYSRKDKPDA